MPDLVPGFDGADTMTIFAADPIAGASLQRRFAITISPADPDLAAIDILAERPNAHRIAKYLKALSVRWALVHDHISLEFVVLECLGPRGDIDQLAAWLRQKNYAELSRYDRNAAAQVRGLKFPHG